MQNCNQKVFFSALFLAVLFFVGDLSAQTPPPNLPPSDQASVVGERVRREGERRLKKAEKAYSVEEEKEKAPPAGEKELRFFVRDIILAGNTWLSKAELGPVLEPFRGRETTFSELSQLTRAIENEYRKRGFISVYAYIPPQRVEQETVTIEIIEGKVGGISVEGNRFFRKSKTLAYSNIKKGDILTYGALRDSLYWMNQNPDREVRSILRRGSETGTTDVIFSVKDRFPVHAGFIYDNESTRPIGENRFGFTLTDDNLTSFDDILTGGLFFGRHFGAVYSEYMFPIARTHTRLVGGFSHAQVAPKKEYKDYGINGTSETYLGRIEQALLDMNLFNIYFKIGMNLGFEFKENRTKMLGGTFIRERLRVLRFGPTINSMDRWGRTDIYQLFSFGIDGLGAAIYADPSASRQGVKPDFFKYTGDITRVQQMPYDTRLQMRARYQLSSTKLSSSEALYLGGASSVRGYPEGDYLADEGILMNFEYLVPCFFVPHSIQLPFSEIPLSKQVELVAFLDEGYGRLRGPSERERDARHMVGVGGGLRVRLYRNLYARAEWAQPVGDSALTGTTKGRFHFRLQAEI